MVALGSRRKIILHGCARIVFVYKTQPAVLNETYGGGCYAVDGIKGNQDVELLLSGNPHKLELVNFFLEKALFSIL